MKRALITGITGQDGSYLAELLLSKGYEVHGLIRRASNIDVLPNIQHIRHLVKLHYGDLTDSGNLRNLMLDIQPDEVYNLAAQSHVHVSFELPQFTGEVNAIGVLNMLEAVRTWQRVNPDVRFYQASTSELYGKVQSSPQTEKTPFYPRSPYGVAKLYGYWMTVNYREGYNLHASNGILFNHESPRRGLQFVTRKITHGLAQIFKGKTTDPLQLGNLDAKRDWGHAKDFVKGMWLMLQQDTPDDYVLSTGTQYSIRDFINKSLEWYECDYSYEGSGISEKVVDKRTGNVIIEVNKEFYRPAEVETLLGDSTKARSLLKWSPEYDFTGLVTEMCESDFNKA